MTNVLLAYIKERNELCDRLATYYALNDIIWTIHTPFPDGTPGHIKVYVHGNPLWFRRLIQDWRVAIDEMTSEDDNQS